MPAEDDGGITELLFKFEQLAGGQERDRIVRKGLRAVGTIVKDALRAATPERPDTPSGTALRPGELKAAIRSRVRIGQEGQSSTETTDFGKLSYVANFVDGGHINPRARRPGKLSYTPPHPFVRGVEESIGAEASEVFIATVEAEIAALMKG